MVGTRATFRFRQTVARVVPLVLAWVPYLAVFALSGLAPWPYWLHLLGLSFLLALAGGAFTVAAIHKQFPYPESLQSWAALINEAVAFTLTLGTLATVLLYAFVAIPLGLIRRILHYTRVAPRLDAALGRYPAALSLTRVVARMIETDWGSAALASLAISRQSAALSLHRAVATRKRELSVSTANALYRLHYHLADDGTLWVMSMDARGPARETAQVIAQIVDRPRIIHARLALFYASRLGLRPPRYRSPLAMHLLLASTELSASLRASRSPDAGLVHLSNAIGARWGPPEGPVRRPTSVERDRLEFLRLLRRYPDIQQDLRYQLLMGMLESGTQLERLAQARQQIHPDPEDVQMLPEERKEREWAEALMAAAAA
ncbi:MAG: hypothetical protein JSV65_01970 [Armatimonadota bacterium]|nr:MAG: hypothetical protein JSV65_01970 [Armatimonadota bacterium]